MRALFAAAAAVLLLSSPVRADDLQRYLVHLKLGDSLKQVQRIYPPSQDWPAYVEPRGRVTRMRADRAFLKKPDPHIETLWLGFKHGSLVEVQVIYTKEFTRDTSADALAGDWSSIYGEPRRTDDGRYYWGDGSTVLRVFYAEVPVLKDKGQQSVEFRTSIQLMDAGLFERVD